MEKPSVYLDTNIFSAYWYDGADVSGLARRLATREWWETERQHFAVWASAYTETELRSGKFRRQAECLEMVRRQPYLPMDRETRSLSDAILKAGIVPSTKPGDAVQMAVSAAHQIDYLRTWNYVHLANPIAQERLEALCGKLGLVAPLLVSPESIPQVRFGQTIRREKRT